MSTLTLVLVITALLFFGSRIKASVSKVLDLVDDGLDVGSVHMSNMKKDAKLSSKLNSIEKRAELQKRLKKFDLKNDKGDALDINDLD
jgi:hypothetical protein